MRNRLLAAAFAIQALLVLSPAVLAADAVSQQIQMRVEQLRASGQLTVAGVPIASVHLIPELYERRQFSPAWQSSERVGELIELIGRAEEEGLTPVDYNYAALAKLQLEPQLDAGARAEFDLLLTDSLTRYGYHLRFGKVNPADLDSNWNLKRDLAGKDPALVIQAAIDSDSLEAFIDKTLERGPYYYRMKEVLAEYRQKEAQGGWPQVPAGETLKPGMRGERVVALRERLRATGEYRAPVPSDPALYDEGLEQAVRVFQADHELDADGAVGKNTLAALNVSAAERVDQIRVNLERTRWVFRDIAQTRNFVLVNIAAFKAMLVRDLKVVWSTPVQVGLTYRKTPVFAADMKYLVFNPTWTVPPSILQKDILPKAKKDPGYLQKKGLKVIDSAGKEINPASLDWNTITPSNFRYQIRQEPGPNNALGQVKFIFPNPHFVFLHDTSHREYFDRTVRTFSSGCIRVKDPKQLAELLLDDSEKWNASAIETAIDSKKTQTVHLKKPMAVMLLYWTLSVADPDKPKFLVDVYERDQPILDALNGEFKYSLPKGMPAWATES